MSLDCRLTLAGKTTLEHLAQRALPDLDERPTGDPLLLSADLHDRYGFDVDVYAGEHGYIDVVSDQGSWVWKPESYVSVSFDLDTSAGFGRLVTNMLTIVRRVLDTGTEDAAFIFNGDILLLTRFDGVLVKHRRDSWWNHYPGANEALPG
ncbi:SitI3 family protein [Actinoplanes aureus]|uniref:Uncharacterized protein n=1 Tax=Actinoplanes aureus TaxID=2792083 RepID=A0A931BYX9_9ACTN|nr:SitI3 family protein [Actinoplanes aureus]MBG0560109.1 hypothetical protein [Actinoplanes aureus]